MFTLAITTCIDLHFAPVTRQVYSKPCTSVVYTPPSVLSLTWLCHNPLSLQLVSYPLHTCLTSLPPAISRLHSSLELSSQTGEDNKETIRGVKDVQTFCRSTITCFSFFAKSYFSPKMFNSWIEFNITTSSTRVILLLVLLV